MERTESQYISDSEASELAAVIIPNIVGDPHNDEIAFALMRIIKIFVECDPDSRETNGCIFQQAIFPHTDAFCRAMEYFAETGRFAASLQSPHMAA